LDSRTDGRAVNRRRKCKACGHRFATEEKIVGHSPKVNSPKMPAKSKQLEPKKPVYQPPKDKGRDLDDIWDEITDDGDSLSLRDLGLD
jgi:hypothetical protein